jgi:hypothetical protein
MFTNLGNFLASIPICKVSLQLGNRLHLKCKATI